MDFKNIILEKKDGLAKLTLNRPPVNVINIETLKEITAALEDVQKDDSVGVLLIRGSGSRAFCAGVEVKDHLGDLAPVMLTNFDRMFQVLRGLGKPSIAVVNGVALGGGCELAAGCDLAVAADKAELGQPEIKLGGLAPAAIIFLRRALGEKKALEMVLLGNNVKAAEAERIGLVNKVVPEADLDKTAEDMARALLKMSRIGVRLVRDAFYECADIPQFSAAMHQSTDLGIKIWSTEDSQEGLKSFLEKRAPVWKNK